MVFRMPFCLSFLHLNNSTKTILLRCAEESMRSICKPYRSPSYRYQLFRKLCELPIILYCFCTYVLIFKLYSEYLLLCDEVDWTWCIWDGLKLELVPHCCPWWFCRLVSLRKREFVDALVINCWCAWARLYVSARTNMWTCLEAT